jgi:carbon storage regulator
VLALTRKTGQSIVLGDPSKPLAVITIEQLRGDRVRLGADAPTSLSINRSEVAAAIVEERKRGDGGKAVGA